jgi:hypothetical protein
MKREQSECAARWISQLVPVTCSVVSTSTGARSSQYKDKDNARRAVRENAVQRLLWHNVRHVLSATRGRRQRSSRRHHYGYRRVGRWRRCWSRRASRCRDRRVRRCAGWGSRCSQSVRPWEVLPVWARWGWLAVPVCSALALAVLLPGLAQPAVGPWPVVALPGIPRSGVGPPPAVALPRILWSGVGPPPAVALPGIQSTGVGR